MSRATGATIRSYPGTDYPMGGCIGIRHSASRIGREAELPVRDMDLFAWHMFIGHKRVHSDLTGKRYDNFKVSELGSPKDEAKEALGTLKSLTDTLKHIVRHGTIVTDRYVPGPDGEFENLDPCELEYYLAKVKAALLQPGRVARQGPKDRLTTPTREGAQPPPATHTEHIMNVNGYSVKAGGAK